MSKVKTDAIETRAGGTSVLTIGTASQTIKLPGGTPGADKVLKSDASGNATWGADVGGALVHLHTTTVDAEVTEIAINDVFTSAYTNYRIVFNNILPVASNNTIYMAFRETSVSAVVNMHSITRWFGVNSAGSLVYGDSPEHNMGGTELFYTATDDGGMNGYVDVFNPFLSGSADWTRTITDMNGYVGHSSVWARVYGAAQATATTSTPCFKIWAGGPDPNIGDASIDGFVRVYGYKDS